MGIEDRLWTGALLVAQHTAWNTHPAILSFSDES